MTTPKQLTSAQHTPEWYAERAKIVTASNVHRLLTAKGDLAFKDDGTPSNDTCRKYLAQIARARVFNRPDREGFVSREMERGTALEPIAREYYQTYRKVTVQETGLWVRDLGDGAMLGASPDGLVGTDGLIEIKTRSEAVQWEAIMAGEAPNEVMPQIFAQMLATDRAWCEYVSFCDGMPLLIKSYSSYSGCNEWFDAITRAVQLAELNIRQLVERFQAASAGLLATEMIPDLND